MANTVLEVPIGISGLAGATLSLFALGGDALLNSGGADTLTERTNATAVYTCTVTEAVTGINRVVVKNSGGAVIFTGYTEAALADTTSTYQVIGESKVNIAVTAENLTTYTNNTPQSGDAFARIGATGSGLTSLAPSATALSTAQWSNTRAGYLDNLNVAGLVASAADIAAITQAQRVRVIVPQMLERPDAGSTTYRVWIYAYNEQHQAEDLDSNPTVTAENNAGTDRSANLSAVTKPGSTTGQYYVDYTVAAAHAIEGLIFKVAATEGATTTNYAAPSIVVDTTAVDFTSADRAKLDTLHDTRLTAQRATNLDNLDVAISASDDAVLTAIAALNNLSSAGAQAAAAAALTAYGAALQSTALLIKTKTDTIPNNPAAVGSEMTLADGAITDAKFTIPALTAPATGIVGMIAQTWRRFFKKTHFQKTGVGAGNIKTYADNGSTVVTTQAITEDATDQDQGAAT